MVNELIKLVAESVVTSVDEQESNDVYMTVEMRMLSTAPNKNGHVIERSFIDEIIQHADFYIGTPVKADTSILARGSMDGLGHKFDKKTKEYMTEQVGSLLSFRAEEEDNEYVLYGVARIEKAHANVCNTIVAMYKKDRLLFSFEIEASDTRNENGFCYIGASEDNHLTGMCIVSVPAYENAKAVKLVAELNTPLTEHVGEMTKWVAELEIDAVRSKVADAIWGGSNPILLGWKWDIREFGTDYVLVKEWDSSRRKMIRYHLENDNVVIDEVYDVELTKVDTNPSVVETPVVTPVVASATEPAAETPVIAEETKPIVAETADGTDEKKSAEEVSKVDDALMAELNALRQFKAKVESDRIDAEKAKSSKTLTLVAQRLGIDVAANNDAIKALNYDKVFASVVEEPEVKTEPVVNLMAGDGMPIGNKWDGYISDASGL